VYITKYPKLSVDKQINRLEERGITFKNISKDDAKEYIEKNNNYFKLTAYRKNFHQYKDGQKIGQYIDLDFSYLKDLAIIDMRFRYVLLLMCLDIEHFSKVRLMKAVEQSSFDGYDLVGSFQTSLTPYQADLLDKELTRNQGNTYCGDLIDANLDEMPVWAFIELISFGRYISFYKHCAEKIANKGMLDEHYLLLSIKELRNATAHNNCIFNDLHPKTSKHRTNYRVSGKLENTKQIRQKKMSNERIRQIVTLLYTYEKLVTSTGVYKHQWEILNTLSMRMIKNIDYYKNNPMILTTFEFLKNVIDNWGPIGL